MFKCPTNTYQQWKSRLSSIFGRETILSSTYSITSKILHASQHAATEWLYSGRKHDLICKLLGYTLTGGIAAIVDAGGFFLLTQTNLPIAPSGILSFCVAALVNYRLTGRFVFSRDATTRGFALFLIAALVELMVNVSVMLASVALLGLWPLAAKVLGIGTAFLVNFFLNVRIVFRTGA